MTPTDSPPRFFVPWSSRSRYAETANDQHVKHLIIQWQRGRSEMAAAEASQHMFPSCNSQWSEEDGGNVWCTDGRRPRMV